MRVQGFDKKMGLHSVDSKGLSERDGASFTDKIDVAAMHAKGEISVVGQGVRGAPARRARGSCAACPALAAKGRERRGSAAATAGGRGRGRGRASQAAHAPQSTRAFGCDLLGRVLDVTYQQLPATLRVCVVSFDDRSGLHKVDSSGLSKWGGLEFIHHIDVNTMFAEGLVVLLDGDDYMRTDGHRLLNQPIYFRHPRDGPLKEARIIGWWPSNLLPPNASVRGTNGTREAVFVAEEEVSGERFLLSESDAMERKNVFVADDEETEDGMESHARAAASQCAASLCHGC